MRSRPGPSSGRNFPHDFGLVVVGCQPACELRAPRIDRVHVERESVYLAGSYCKLSRQVSQTPWNEAHGDVKHSVQSLIVAAVGSEYRAEHVKFMGAGREDLDVRMLGTGRPFLLEFVNARSLPTAPHVRIGKDEVADRDAAYLVLEDRVNQSTDLIEIRDLRSVGKEWVKMLKNAGETKVKTYQAVVWMERAVSKSALEKLSGKAPFNIDQTTPIRVLHRRSLAVRKRMVHTIKCEAINPHFMIITLSTEAGTVRCSFVATPIWTISLHSTRCPLVSLPWGRVPVKAVAHFALL